MNGRIAVIPLALAPVVLLLGACMSPMAEPATTPAAATTQPTAGAPAAQPSALSYGTVTSQVQKGKTTQSDLLQLFGGPNISTTDADGAETWVYERTVSQTDSSTQSKELSGAMNLGFFFSFGNAGASGSASKASTASSTTTSIRSLTAIVKFNGDKTVKDYSVRASYF